MYKKSKILLLVLAGVFISVVLRVIPLMAEGMNGHEHHMMAETSQDTGEDIGVCPITGEHANKDYSYTYKGKTYYFCCQACVAMFKNNPEKYVSKIKEINLEAYQFGFSPEVITVKKGDIVRILATSRDVPHGIYIKEFDVNITVKKGEVKKMEFVADKTGEFDILCSVYCGKGHHKMKAKLIVKK